MKVFSDELEAAARKVRDRVKDFAVRPIDMILHCPRCHVQHIDKDEGAGMLAEDVATYGEPWRNPPHRSHLCASCGCIWRPADVATNGVTEIKTRGERDNWPAR